MGLLTEYLESLKKVDYVAKFSELAFFAITIGLIITMTILFHYSSINNYVKKNSRCVREKAKGSQTGSYTVYGMNEKNQSMYKVTYTPKTKEYKLECACNKGMTMNTFDNIKIYNMRNPESPIQYVNEQRCYCDSIVEPEKNTYYSGHPDLMRFMYSGDTSFFTSV